MNFKTYLALILSILPLLIPVFIITFLINLIHSFVIQGIMVLLFCTIFPYFCIKYAEWIGDKLGF
jgi:hypothetical protein